MKYYIGIDLGGTNIAVGVVTEEGKIVLQAKLKTNLPRTADAIADDMASLCLSVVKQAGLTMEQIENIGIGSPGVANSDTGNIDYSCNLQFFGVPLARMMEQRTQKKIYLENDASAAALGEYVAGAGKGTRFMIAVTLGTGVGGGIIIDGKLYSGFNFGGAELGHMVIQKDGLECNCGRKGCFEAYASATGLIKMTKRKMPQNPDSALWKLAEGNVNNIDGASAFQAMRAGDKAGKEVVEEYIDYLACGVANIVNIFQPEILCIGGGISKEGNALIQPLASLVDRQSYGRYCVAQTAIVPAQLGNDAGIIGAALLSSYQNQ